jgi:hypothetical protein
MATQTEEILLRMGFDGNAVARGTQAMLDSQKKAAMDYVDFWKTALAKRDAAETRSNDESIARLKQNLQKKAELQQRWFENQAAQKEIAEGSIPQNMQTGRAAGRSGSGAGGIAAATLVQDVVHGSGMKEAAKDAGYIAASVHLGHAVNRLVEGKNPYSGLSKLPHAIEKVVEAVIKHARVIGGVTASIFAAYDVGRLGKADIEKQKAKQQEIFSKSDLVAQTAGIKGRLEGMIDDFAARGLIKETDAENLRRMTGDKASSEDVRHAQQFLMKAQAAEAEKIAAAEERTAEAARAAAVAAEDKAVSEKAALEKQKEGEELNRQYARLMRERDQIYADYNRVEQETPTISDLAGRDYTARLNKNYGKGGIYDLGKGDGPFAQIAQDYELAQKQQQWDIIHGNAIFDKKGALIGGDAFDDKRRMIADANKLGAAGLETPAMKFEAMKEHLNDISTSMSKLLERADGIGININVPEK